MWFWLQSANETEIAAKVIRVVGEFTYLTPVFLLSVILKGIQQKPIKKLTNGCQKIKDLSSLPKRDTE